jgi:ubiquitin C-terminal hydrolase
MRGSTDTGQPKCPTPMVFQQILAFGGENTMFNDLDGTTQQDCFEYFGALMSGATSTTVEESGAASEDSAEGAATLESLFEIKSETTTRCTSCDQNIAVKVETSNAISVPVLSKKGVKLMDLLEASKTSIWEGRKCPKCDKEELVDVDGLRELSDNLVVHIQRVDPSDTDRKLQTQVEVPLTPITICGKQFVLNDVVRHKGQFVDRGHYTVLRRRSSEWMTDDKSLWYLIDDHKIESIKTSDVRDGTRRSHSAMLLFKAL